MPDIIKAVYLKKKIMTKVSTDIKRINHLDKTVRILKELGIVDSDWCLVASSVLAVHGLRSNRDIDVCVSDSVYKDLLARSESQGWKVRSSGTIVIGDVDLIKDEYIRFGINSEKLLKDSSYHQIIDGIKVARMELEFAKHAWPVRDKDKKDMPLLEEFALKNSKWDWGLVREPLPSFKHKKTIRKRIREKLRSLKIRTNHLFKVTKEPSLWPIKKPGNSLYLTILLWPPAQAFFDEIERDIKNKHSIRLIQNISMTKEKFANLTRKIYELENIPRWKVERKLHYLNQHDLHIRLLVVKIDRPRWRADSEQGRFYSAYSHQLKKSYRAKYRDRVSNYVHDTVIHASDDHNNSLEMKELVLSYYNKS